VPAIWDSWYPEGHQTIGLQARLFPGIDLDINTEEQAMIAKNLAFEIFGETVLRGRTDGSPRLLLPYRFAEGTPPITKIRQDYIGRQAASSRSRSWARPPLPDRG
jgi:hypothetical protein